MSFHDCTTAQERVDYLKGHPIQIDSQFMLDGSRKVGDTSAVSTGYRGLVRDVQVTPWMTSASAAAKAAEDFVETWDGSLPE